MIAVERRDKRSVFLFYGGFYMWPTDEFEWRRLGRKGPDMVTFKQVDPIALVRWGDDTTS